MPFPASIKCCIPSRQSSLSHRKEASKRQQDIGAKTYEVNVITCAAPNLREHPTNAYNVGDGSCAVQITDKELLELHEKRLRRILDVAVMEGNEAIILGVFGYGAFSNNPQVVAQAAKNVTKEYLHAFKNIEFAVYCSPWDERNYRVFERMLGCFCS